MSRPRLRSVMLAAGVLLVAAPAAAHDGTFHDAYTKSLQHCSGCHGVADDGGPQPENGGFQPEKSEDGWRNALVGAVPTNEAARAHGKLRVHEYLPWNSYLLDKLTGHLKAGEGRAMRSGVPGSVGLPAEEEDCPGLVSEVYNWILHGALAQGFAPGDDAPFGVPCNRTQPLFPPVPVPAGGEQIDVDVVEVVAPALEAADEVTVSSSNTGELLVGRIEVLASPGTEYVTVRRAGDEVPLVVARGQRDPLKPRGVPPGAEPDLFVRAKIELPDGVAIRLGGSQQLVIGQHLRNDYWLTEGSDGNPHADRHYNRTAGRVIVTFHPVADPAAVVHTAEPFVEDTGTRGMFLPPWALGATGGAWIPAAPLNGAVVGLWSDQRLIRGTLSDPTGAPLNLGDVSRQYVSVGSGPSPVEGVIYACAHSNGTTDNPSGDLRRSQPLKFPGTAQLVSRPLRWGCEEAALLPDVSLPPGAPGEPATACHRSTEDQNDCGGLGTERCVPANLVGGPGVEDGRCALVGVAW